MTGLGNIDDVYNHYLKVIDENTKLKELLKELQERTDRPFKKDKTIFDFEKEFKEQQDEI